MTTQCRLCGASQSREIFTKDGSSYAQCGVCGLVFIANPFGVEQNKQLYDEASNLYLTDRLKADYAISYAREFAQIEAHRQKAAHARLLDVGCATGAFLAAAKQRGYEVAGVELASASAEYVRSNLDAPVFQGRFEEMPLPDQPFDVVSMQQVLEHLYDPSTSLQKAHTILKDKGILFVSVPNYDSFSRYIRGKEHWVFNEGHLFYFTAKTLGELLSRNGFSVMHCHTSLGGRFASKPVQLGLKAAGPILEFFKLGGVLEIIARKEA